MLRAQTPTGQLCTEPACNVWVTWLQSGQASFGLFLWKMRVGTRKSEGRQHNSAPVPELGPA